MRILLYSPEGSTTESVARILQQCTFHIDSCTTRDRLMYLTMTERYAAVIIRTSASLSELTDLYKEWKASGTTNYLVIMSGNNSGLQRAKMLEMGVDQYYIEPCSCTQLVSDILRHEYEDVTNDSHVHTTSYFELDLLRHTAIANGNILKLTKTEFELLALLLRRKGAVLSRMQIWEEIWGYEAFPLANTVDVHVNRLRKKLPHATRPMLTTVYGIGYRMQVDA